jgi:hypothetical protein
MNVREANFESIVDGNWHWCPTNRTEEPKAGMNDISVVVQASNPGYRPKPEHHRLFAGYETETDGFTYLGMDMYASQGRLHIAGRQVLAVMTPWPAPDFMGSDDGAWFIRAWTPREQEAGHFHMPAFYILEQDTIAQLRQS